MNKYTEYAISVAACLGLVCTAILYAILQNGTAHAAGKFTLPETIVQSWLDNGNNQKAFIIWAEDTLTSPQMESLETLIAPQPSDMNKALAVKDAIEVLTRAGIKSGDALDALKEEAAKLPSVADKKGRPENE